MWTLLRSRDTKLPQMALPVCHLILTPSSPVTPTVFSSFPPKPPISNPRLSWKQRPHQCLHLEINISRRDVALLSFISPSLFWTFPATAFSIGISGPRDWLKEQKKNSSRFLLAPVDASRQSLRTAYILLTASDSSDNRDKKEFQSLLQSAARDCVPEERNSFVSFQSKTGVEVCTFRLIVKNASSLLGNKDPVKLKAETLLNDLIRSFSSLSVLANEADIQLRSQRFHFIRETIFTGVVKVEKVSIEENPSDMLTKPLDGSKFRICIHLLRVAVT